MLTIVWDIDDTLNSLMFEYLKYSTISTASRAKFPHFKNVPFQDLKDNPPCDILGLSMEEYQASLDDFRLNHYSSLQLNEGILEWFEAYGHLAYHEICTAVPLKAAHISASWVLCHLGKWVRRFHFIPSKREGEKLKVYDSSKAEFLKRHGKVDVFIDDNPVNIQGSKLLSIDSYLVAQPWNQDGMEIKEILDGVAKKVKNESL